MGIFNPEVRAALLKSINKKLPIAVNSLALTSPNQDSNLQPKVIATEEPIKVNEWTKQDVTIGDSTGKLKQVAWENAVSKLTEGQSYRSTAATVKLYAEEMFLSLGSQSHFKKSRTLVL